MLDWSATPFRKAARSHLEGEECVEVAGQPTAAGRVVGVRDSKNPAGPVLEFSARRWATFLSTTR